MLAILQIFIFFYNVLLYFQTVDIFLWIPLCTEIIYIESTNKIRFLLEYLILCLLFTYYRDPGIPQVTGLWVLANTLKFICCVVFIIMFKFVAVQTFPYWLYIFAVPQRQKFCLIDSSCVCVLFAIFSTDCACVLLLKFW